MTAFAQKSAPPRSAGLTSLMDRGLLNQATDLTGLDDAFEAGIVPVYAGFDATADSLHIGHLLPLMILRRLQQAGHKPIVLIGGGTTRIGDPSFRADARPMLSNAQIAENVAGIRRIFDRLLTFGDGPTDAVLVNNADWLDGLHYIDVLRDVGRHFSVNRMLTFDSVRSRLDRQDNLSFLEFNYMILQAYDFLELSRRTGCRLQVGGADQWANIINGVDLIRRVEGTEAFGLTAPLLTTSSGVKMGKTAAGAVWLNADRLSPYDFWQFLRNTEDADVARFLKIFTDLSLTEIADLTQNDGAALNAAKIRLATETTAIVHGWEEALEAAETAQAAFADGAVAEGLPTVDLTPAEFLQGVPLVDLIIRAELALSRGEARRAIEGRGIRLDGVIIGDAEHIVSPQTPVARLSMGRKRHVIVRIQA